MNTTKERILTATIAVITGILVTLIAQYLGKIIFTDGEAELSALVDRGPLYYPPEITQELETLSKNLADDDDTLNSRLENLRTKNWGTIIAEAISMHDSGVEDIDFLSRSAALAVESEMPTLFDVSSDLNYHKPFNLARANHPRLHDLLYNTPTYSGYWRLAIMNTGERVAHSVRIRLPNAEFASVHLPGEAPKHLVVDEEIQLGELLPDQQADVIAWTVVEPSLFLIDRISLVHSEGIGSVELAPEEQLPSDWPLKIMFLFGTLLVGTIVIPFFVAWLKKLANGPKDAAEQ